jgi:hypothetical protein
MADEIMSSAPKPLAGLRVTAPTLVSGAAAK